MKILVSTFGGDDEEKVLSAMRSLPYERLVLIGGPEARNSAGFRELRRLEDMSGHEIEFVEVEICHFMDAVEDISTLLAEWSRDTRTGRANQVMLNISGGSKLLCDAALFSAFRLGIETYHCDKAPTRLPVLRGATTVDRFSAHQVRFMRTLTDGAKSLDALVEALAPANRQSIDRTLRQLRKQGLLSTGFDTGRILISLSKEGEEVVRALGHSAPSEAS